MRSALSSCFNICIGESVTLQPSSHWFDGSSFQRIRVFKSAFKESAVAECSEHCVFTQKILFHSVEHPVVTDLSMCITWTQMCCHIVKYEIYRQQNCTLRFKKKKIFFFFCCIWGSTGFIVLLYNDFLKQVHK